MPMGVIFWILMLLWLVYGMYRDWPNYPIAGHNLLLFVVVSLLGWQVFGPAIR